MIEAVHLQHFKCFEKLDLPLSPLTLLAGLNAGGKSSVIQALLLLKQSRASLRFEGRLNVRLNGIDVDLGTVGDVMDERTARDCFSIGFTTEATRLDVICAIEDRAALVAKVCRIEEHDESGTRSIPFWPEQQEEWTPWEQLLQLLHVSTERIGPRETYSADTGAPEDSWHLGPRGEYTAWILDQRRDAAVVEALCRPDVPPTLLRQVEAWLGAFFPGAALDVRRIEGTNLVTLRLRTSASGNFHRPQNVGFGLTHILPILVGALAIGDNGILIVENPETHLHPSAQALMGRFLAQVAQSGRQVIIESHSDHVLNGLRVAVKDGVLAPELVKIYFFNRRPAEGETASHIISPTITAKGQIDEWPKGFFDQYEKDLEILTSWD